jgi:putative ABC transport system permease protein
VGLPSIRYDERHEAWGFFEQLRDRVAALPGVEAATTANIVPLQGNSWEMTIYPEGVPIDPENANSVLYYLTTPEYFETIGVEIVRGRAFTEADGEGSVLTAVVDESMAEQFWPGEDPIGKRVTFESDDAEDGSEVRVYRTVIGVARNVRHYELESPSRIQIYVPMAQSHNNWTGSMYLLAKTSVPPETITEAVRREVASLDAEVPLYRVETMEGYVADAMGGTRALSGFLTVFAGFAMLLSTMGIFGVITYQVVQRVREIGIRMALGASASSVLRMVTVQGLAITGTGVVLGLVGAFLLSRVMASLLFEVSPVEPVVYAGLAGLIVAISTTAALIPARWATRVDPAVVLREE